MRSRINNHSRRSDSLFIVAVMFCGCYIFMRGLAAGIESFSPEDYFLSLFSLAGLLTAVLSRLLCNGLIMPAKRILFTAGIYLLTIFVSYLIAALVNYKYLAVNLGSVWVSDILMFIAVIITARERDVFKFYYSLLSSILAVAGLYTIYQRIYGIKYLQDIFNNSEVFREKIFNKGLISTQFFINRLQDGWVGGGFEDTEALAAFALLITFFCYGIEKREAGKREFFDIAIIMGLVCVVFSGSWYAVIIGKVAEIIFLKREVRISESTFKKILTVIGGVGIFSILFFVVTLFFYALTDTVVAQSIYALLWFIEIKLLSRHISTDVKRFEYLEGLAFLFILSIVCVLVWLSSSVSDLGTVSNLFGYLFTKEMAGISTAWSAFIDSPLFGWGLGNYSEIYPFYQSNNFVDLSASTNLFITFLADGGIILFLGFTVFMFVILFTGNIERREYKELGTEFRYYMQYGIMIVLVSFLLVYLLISAGLFDRMGVDFLLLELTASPESNLARMGEYFPLIFHVFINCIVLPVFAVYIFVISFKSEIDFTAAVFFIKLSTGAFLLYSLCGNYLYHSAVSGYFWVMLGLLVSREQVWGILNIRMRIRSILAYLMLILAVLWGAWGMWSGFARASVERGALNLAGRYAEEEKLEQALKYTEEALTLSKINADLLIQQADFMLQQHKFKEIQQLNISDFDEIKQLIAKAIELRPFASRYYLFMADFLADYATENKEEIIGYYKKARELYPFNARYHYLFALYLQKEGDKQAGEYATRAIRLSQRYVNDYRVGLNRFELSKAREIAYENMIESE